MVDKVQRPELTVNPEHALRPFLRSDEQILWCSWSRPQGPVEMFWTTAAMMATAQSPVGIWLLIVETYRFYLNGTFVFPWMFFAASIIVSLAIGALFVRFEGGQSKPILSALTDRRCVSIYFDGGIQVDPDAGAFDLLEMQKWVKYMNYEDVQKVIVVMGVIQFLRWEKPILKNVTLSKVKSPYRVLALLPARGKALLSPAQQRSIEALPEGDGLRVRMTQLEIKTLMAALSFLRIG